MCKEIEEKEADSMIMSAEKYNKEVFLIELEESLKEMKEKRKSKAKKTAQSSWRDLFTTEKK
jgi:hypothetical protein